MQEHSVRPAQFATQNEVQSETSESTTSNVSPLQRAVNGSARVAQLKRYQTIANKGPIQRVPDNINGQEEQGVRERALDRNPQALTEDELIREEAIRGHGQGENDTAMVIREANSMAANPQFEAAAIAWETRFGGIAYNDPRANAVVDSAAQVAKNYLVAKWDEWNSTIAGLQTDLQSIGMSDPGWAGAVGTDVDRVMDALDNGPLAVKIAHFERFANRVLATDMLEMDRWEFEDLATKAKLDTHVPEFVQGIHDVKAGKRLNVAKGAAGEQWHMRAKRHQNPTDNQSERTVGEVEQNTGMEYSDMEKDFMGVTNEGDRVPRNEGARVWALNERDKWVHAMREMSLPLLAGVSGTTARMMQAFKKLGLNGNPSHSRLACVGYLLPNRHHSLVEIMTGAAENGGPAFAAHPRFYRQIAPFLEEELRTAVQLPFPDEVLGE